MFEMSDSARSGVNRLGESKRLIGELTDDFATEQGFKGQTQGVRQSHSALS